MNTTLLCNYLQKITYIHHLCHISLFRNKSQAQPTAERKGLHKGMNTRSLATQVYLPQHAKTRGWCIHVYISVCVCVCVCVTQSCLTLCDPVDQAPLTMGFSRQEYWIALPCLPPRGSSWPRDRTCVPCTGRQVLYHWGTREVKQQNRTSRRRRSRVLPQA